MVLPVHTDRLKKFYRAILVLVLVLATAPGLVACGTDNQDSSQIAVPAEVLSFNSSSQVTGSVSYVNYTVTVKASINWENLSSDRQTAIVNYAFAEARQRNEQNGVSNYNIVGYSEATTEQPSRPLFMWDKENDLVIIYQNGAQSGTIPAPAP